MVAPFEMETYAVNKDETRCVFRTEDDKLYEVELPNGIPKEILWCEHEGFRASVDDALIGTNVIRGVGQARDWSGRAQEYRNAWAQTNGWKAVAVPGLGAKLSFYKPDKETIRIVDNPGWMHMSSRSFWNPVFVNDTQCLFDDRDSIYLIDLEKRRVGFVVHGTKPGVIGRPARDW